MDYRIYMQYIRIFPVEYGELSRRIYISSKSDLYFLRVGSIFRAHWI